VQVREGWPARSFLQPHDILLRVGEAPCPKTLSKLRACLRGAVGTAVELSVQAAGSSSTEGVRSMKIVRRLPRPSKKAEVRAWRRSVQQRTA